MEKEEKKWINESHVALVGGRVEIGESSEQTIRREIMVETIHNIEGEDELRYDWIDIDKINEYPLKPKILKNMILYNKFTIHKINEDRK